MLCTSLDLPELFRTGKTSVVESVQERDYSLLVQFASTCKLCSAVLKILDFQYAIPADVDTAGLVCKMLLIGYGDIVSRPSGEIVGLKRLSHVGANISTVKRLNFQLVPFQSQSRRLLGVGMQIKAPENNLRGRLAVLHGRLVDPEFNESLVSSWIKTCSTEHGLTCTIMSPAPSDDWVRLKVVDVKEMCIADAQEDIKYMALSYVWGGIQQLRLLKENEVELTKPNGLRQHLADMPQTIKDAIELTRRLGERYLWIDALCIVQDDADDVAAQIPNMDKVYGRASVTIVAAYGENSNAGLPGITPRSRRRCDVDVLVDGISVIAGLPTFHETLRKSVWETRGWTFQEKILSKRLLIFTEYQMFYHCNLAIRCEDAIWENPDPYFQLQPSAERLDPEQYLTELPRQHLSTLDRYHNLISAYRSRQLTLESDALNAFSGVISAFRRELNTEVVWDIPVAQFNETILWEPLIHDPTSRRDFFPSWSCLGWKASSLPGDITWPCSLETHVETIPRIKWYSVSADGGLSYVKTDKSASSKPLPMVDLEVRLEKVALRQNCLCFWAECTDVLVSKVPQDPGDLPNRYGCGYFLFGVRHDGGFHPMGRISLNVSWRQSQPDCLEFMIMSTRKVRSYYEGNPVSEVLNLMLIETSIEGVSYRVQTATDVLSSWYDYLPWKERVVILG
jgi:hypothetical protein